MRRDPYVNYYTIMYGPWLIHKEQISIIIEFQHVTIQNLSRLGYVLPSWDPVPIRKNTSLCLWHIPGYLTVSIALHYSLHVTSLPLTLAEVEVPSLVVEQPLVTPLFSWVDLSYYSHHSCLTSWTSSHTAVAPGEGLIKSPSGSAAECWSAYSERGWTQWCCQGPW